MSDEFPTADDLLREWDNKQAPKEKPRLGDTKPPPIEGDPDRQAMDLIRSGLPYRIIDMSAITPDQHKAIASILAGDAFITIGIKVKAEDTHDFFVAIKGDHGVLKQAQPEIQGLVDRAFIRRGIL